MIIAKKNKQQFHAIKYLNEIISSDIPAFKFVNIDIKDGIKRLATTDARQLHIFYDKENWFKKLKPGLYRLWISKSEAILTYDKDDQKIIYPNIDKVIPEKYKTRSKVSIRYVKSNYNAKAIFDINALLAKAETNNFINPVYLNQTLKYQFSADCYVSEANQPIVFENENYLTIIMPMVGDQN